MKIKLAGIIETSISNGEGIRKVIFVQGCKHDWIGCFNPETHSFYGGTEYDTSEIINCIKEDFIIDGVTFSGGDPFEQAEAVYDIAKHFDNIWCYTGYTIEYILNHIDEHPFWEELLNCIDYLVDGRFEIDLKDSKLKYRGSSNQRIINVQEYLNELQDDDEDIEYDYIDDEYDGRRIPLDEVDEYQSFYIDSYDNNYAYIDKYADEEE